jgi:pyruvate dehydrogenase E2 component (dihydrolipoamide acetyltransferase)
MLASPAARRLARELGVDLTRVRGTGPGGRIVLSDVEAAAAEQRVERAAAPERREEPGPSEAAGKRPERSMKIRRIVARKMVESWQSAPHFFVTVAVDMTDVIRIRKDLRASINDFMLAAAARCLRDYPWVNSHWVEGQAVEQERINIAIAVATERGLYNPVLRDCARLSLKEISRRAADLVERAHAGRLNAEDLEGGTFTISNMGMLGVESFTAIITPPQAAVLAVGTVRGEAVVDEKGEPGIAPLVRLTLSADHRILDGADAAEFLGAMKSYLEAPVTLISFDYGKD